MPHLGHTTDRHKLAGDQHVDAGREGGTVSPGVHLHHLGYAGHGDAMPEGEGLAEIELLGRAIPCEAGRQPGGKRRIVPGAEAVQQGAVNGNLHPRRARVATLAGNAQGQLVSIQREGGLAVDPLQEGCRALVEQLVAHAGRGAGGREVRTVPGCRQGSTQISLYFPDVRVFAQPTLAPGDRAASD
ncbi:hypothetical protein D9M68_524520 [compost metagenome]